jgi:hypothetical protein
MAKDKVIRVSQEEKELLNFFKECNLEIAEVRNIFQHGLIEYTNQKSQMYPTWWYEKLRKVRDKMGVDK